MIRALGLIVLVLSGLLLWYAATPVMASAPILLAFAYPAGVGAAVLGLMMVAGKA